MKKERKHLMDIDSACERLEGVFYYALWDWFVDCKVVRNDDEEPCILVRVTKEKYRHRVEFALDLQKRYRGWPVRIIAKESHV